jgi:hypothetical protein
LKTTFVTFLAVSLLCSQHSMAQSGLAPGQPTRENNRSREILAMFNKTKYESREKLGIHKDRFRQIQSEPVVRRALLDYLGTCRAPDLGYTVRIATTEAGVSVTGTEPPGDSHAVRRFRLENTSLDGALLKGTKVYEDGNREQFEGLFIDVTDTEGVSPTELTHQAKTFGLGVVSVHGNVSEMQTDKVFCHFER